MKRRAKAIENVTNLCSDKKDVLITHLVALGAMERVSKAKLKALQESELVVMMNRIVSGQEKPERKESRNCYQRVNFIQACRRKKGRKSCKLELSYSEIFLALEYGADAKVGLHALNLDVSEFGEDSIILNTLELFIKYGADINCEVSHKFYVHNKSIYNLFRRICCGIFVLKLTAS
jgi:hypothetical protein